MVERKGRKVSPESIIADSIISHAKLLVPSAPWNLLLSETVFSWTKTADANHLISGRGIVVKEIARTIHSVQNQTGWTLGSPQLVYMSGYYLLGISSAKLQNSSQRVEEIRSGIRSFPDEERKNKAIEETQDTIRLITDFNENMQQALEQFCADHFPGSRQGKEYGEILQSLLTPTGKDNFDRKKKIIAFLAEGNVDSAYEEAKNLRPLWKQL